MMSKEAKIGLLFSLIFIVAIAVILRNVHDDTVGSYDHSKIMNVDKNNTVKNLSSAVKSIIPEDQAPQQVKDIISQINPQREPRTREYIETTQAGYAETAANTASTNDQPVRYRLALPGSTLEQQENGAVVRTELPSGEVEKAINGSVSSPNNFQSDYQNLRNRLANNQTTTTTTTTTAQPAKAVVHQVAEGENLTVIAMKYYGKKEGNRLVNIDKIFEANTKILSSRDSVRVGQRLVIPPLEGIELNSQTATTGTTTPTKSNGSRVYKVQENDSLWRIADKELGNGTRFNEIIKLNSKILGDSNCLQPGMKLLLPEK